MRKKIQESVGIKKYMTMDKSAYRLLLSQVIYLHQKYQNVQSQAINPMILLHIPTFVNFYQAEVSPLPHMVRHKSVIYYIYNIIYNRGHVLHNQVNRVLCILMNVFSVTNPLFNIIFSTELRKSLSLRILGRKKSSISLVQL